MAIPKYTRKSSLGDSIGDVHRPESAVVYRVSGRWFDEALEDTANASGKGDYSISAVIA